MAVDAACAATFQQTIVQTNTPSSRGYFYHVIRGDSFQRWWRAGRGRGTEREPLSVYLVGNAAQVSTPRVHFCTFSSIGRVIWFLALVANSTSGITKPKLPVTSIALRRSHQSLAGGRAGRRIFARFGSTCTFQSRPRVSTWLLFISKGEYVFLFRREQCHRTKGFRPRLPMPPAVSAVAMHPRRVHGWDAESANFGSFSFLSRSHAATIALIGADTPRSFSRR